jgi:hypothetical protein
VAAAVGVPLLAALHVSQAREVERLRARAGRAQRSRRVGARHATAALAVLLLLGAAVAASDDDAGTARPEKRAATKRTRKPAVVKPGSVTVAVLNGTTVPGLAAALREQIAAAGFKKGPIDVFSDQQVAESVVQYAPGQHAAAKAVGRTLGISRREAVTAGSRALAGAATVIVIAGADQAPR